MSRTLLCRTLTFSSILAALVLGLALLSAPSTLADAAPSDADLATLPSPGATPIGEPASDEPTPTGAAIYYTYTISDVRYSHETYRWNGYLSKGWGPITLSISESFNHGHSYAVSLGVSASIVSAAVNFNVDWSVKTTPGGAYAVPKGKYGWFGFSDTWAVYRYHVKKWRHVNGGKKLIAECDGTASKWDGYEFTGTTTSGPGVRPPAPH